MEKQILLFQNPVFSEMNVTVRLGDKWKNRVGVGDIVSVRETGKEDIHLIDAEIKQILSVKFKLLNGVYSNLLKFEHDPNCRNYKGLTETMTSVYGPTFNVDSIITVLAFSTKI